MSYNRRRSARWKYLETGELTNPLEYGKCLETGETTKSLEIMTFQGILSSDIFEYRKCLKQENYEIPCVWRGKYGMLGHWMRKMSGNRKMAKSAKKCIFTSQSVPRSRDLFNLGEMQVWKTSWIISLVNNWEAWWEHHVARRFNFPGEFNILYQYHCISTLLPRNGSVLYPPIQEEMVIRRNIALGPCILNFSKLKALCIVSSAKK